MMDGCSLVRLTNLPWHTCFYGSFSLEDSWKARVAVTHIYICMWVVLFRRLVSFNLITGHDRCRNCGYPLISTIMMLSLILSALVLARHNQTRDWIIMNSEKRKKISSIPRRRGYKRFHYWYLTNITTVLSAIFVQSFLHPYIMNV